VGSMGLIFVGGGGMSCMYQGANRTSALLMCDPPSLVRSGGGGAGGQVAKDALGNDVKLNSWLATHPKGDRSLTQGLKVNGRA